MVVLLPVKVMQNGSKSKLRFDVTVEFIPVRFLDVSH